MYSYYSYVQFYTYYEHMDHWIVHVGSYLEFYCRVCLYELKRALELLYRTSTGTGRSSYTG